MFEHLSGLHLTGGMVVTAIVVAYAVARYRGPSPLPSGKPRLAMMPKYRFALAPPAALADPETPPETRREEIVRRMAELSYRLRTISDNRLIFVRGKIAAEFVGRTPRTHVILPFPLGANAPVVVRYGDAALFDTGELYETALDVRRILSLQTVV